MKTKDLRRKSDRLLDPSDASGVVRASKVLKALLGGPAARFRAFFSSPSCGPVDAADEGCREGGAPSVLSLILVSQFLKSLSDFPIFGLFRFFPEFFPKLYKRFFDDLSLSQ